MALDSFLASFALPAAALSDFKIPKSVFVRSADLTSTDKKLVTTSLKDLRVVSSVTDSIAGTVPSGYLNTGLQVAEIIFLQAELVPSIGSADSRRIEELLHRSIPNPVILRTVTEVSSSFSIAIKRQNEADTSKHTIVRFFSMPENRLAGLDHMAISAQVYFSLAELYESWFTRFYGAWIAEALALPPHFDLRLSFAESCETYDSVRRISDDLVIAIRAAKAEKQLNRRVEFNGTIHRLKASLNAQAEQLT